MACPFASSVESVTAITVMLGFYYGSVYVLLTSLTISVVGLHRLAFAFGVEMISAGFGFLVAPPIAGGLCPDLCHVEMLRPRPYWVCHVNVLRQLP